MKMKEVLEQTDLTDRAVRLYMENGLVSPSCSENYAGRKNIEFSEEDVDKLNNIATLRKAGFSISEIKLMGSGQVRYIMEYNAGSPVGYYTIPYHINMHW